VQNYSSVGQLTDMLIIRDGALMKTCQTPAGRWNALRNAIVAVVLVMTAGFVAAQSDDIELNPAHPEKYTVKSGDTLWDISGMFLKDPWYWPEIWYVNPQVENPHLIYPGDELTLVYVDGQPRVQLTRGANVTGPTGTERLSPQVREEALSKAITTIPFSVIEPFLSGGMILDKDELDSLPYIVALRDHLIAGSGHEVYVTGIAEEDQSTGSEFMVLRKDDKLRDPDTNKVLGYEVVFIGSAELRAKGEPATFFLTDSNREASRGDLIRPVDLRLPMNFFPRAPEQEVNGSIISVVDGVSRIGQFQMVILNRGSNDGLEAGTVLAVWQNGETTRDNRDWGKKVSLPDTFAGNLMVVKAYDDIAYALVVEAVSEMRVYDRVKNP
jgi:hypothetical protein